MKRPPSCSKITVEEFTSTDPITVGPDTPIETVSQLFREHRFRHIPVVEGQKVLGVIDDRDLLWQRPLGATEKMVARNIMTRNPYTVHRDEPIENVALTLSQEKLSSALVVDSDGGLYGIFTTTDAINALIEIVRSPK